jgi:predicted RNase H-like HicB family nuclease
MSSLGNFLGSDSTTDETESTDNGKSKLVRLHVAIAKEDDEDQYSIIALNLPGCASCGDSEVEAIENIKEAASGLIESYDAAGVAIPWKDSFSDAIPPGAKTLVVTIHA